MPVIKAIIFDAGGVLVRYSLDIYPFLYSNNISELEWGLFLEQYADDWTKGKINESQFWQFCQERFPQVGEISKPCPFHKEFAESAMVVPEVLDIALKYKYLGYKIAILSNTMDCHWEHTRKLGIHPFFDSVVVSCEVGMMKPEASIYLYTASKLGVPPKNCIMVDDKGANYWGARNAGLKAVLWSADTDSVDKLDREIRKLLYYCDLDSRVLVQ